jgi:hypothetical protein
MIHLGLVSIITLITVISSLIINNAEISLAELRTAHTETFPKLFG